MSKPWWQSKTVWLNIIAAIVSIGSALNTVVPQSWLPVIGLVVGIANIVLRFFTSGTPITLSSATQ